MTSTPIARALVLLMLSAAACHSSGADHNDGGSGGSGDGGDASLVAAATSVDSDGTLRASIGPITLAPGEETTRCAVLRLPNTADVDVVQIETALAPGSHHLIIYRTDATAEQRVATPCTSFAGVLRDEAPLFIAESAATVMKLPSGVAYHLAAGQMVRLEAHFLNAGLAPIRGQGTIKLTPAPPGGSYQAADIMMCGSVRALFCASGGGLPPGRPRVTLPMEQYDGGNGVDLTQLHIFAFTSHEHHRGSDVTIWKTAAAGDTLLYENRTWDSPPLTVLDDAHLLTLGPGEGIGWQCSYDTSNETQKVCWGESGASSEMCYIWAYYYPSIGRFISQYDCWY